jgi:MFS family permease
MTRRKPVFTVLSLLIAFAFALGSRPFLIHSFDQQLAAAQMNSADAIEDAGRMAGFALIAGQVMLGGIGAVIGVVLAGIGFGRRERWQAFRWGSMVLNLIIAVFVGATFIPLWWSQHRKTENNQPNKSCLLTGHKLLNFMPISFSIAPVGALNRSTEKCLLRPDT